MIPGIVASIIKLINVNNTVLQLKMNGVTGSNVFIDTSPTNKQIITYGDAIIVNNNFGSRLYLDGSNCALRVDSHADFSFGSDDFTIRARFTLVGGQPYARLINFGDYWHNFNSFGILAKDASYPGKLTFASYKLGQSRLLVSTTTIVVGQEYYIEVSRISGMFRLFIDGVLESTNNSYIGVSMELGAENTLAVGSAYAPNVEEQFHGYIDDVEIIKGVGLHESNFTPPPPDELMTYVFDLFNEGDQINLRQPNPINISCIWKDDPNSQLAPTINSGMLTFGEETSSAILNISQFTQTASLFEFSIGLLKPNLLEPELNIQLYFGYDPGDNGPPDYFTAQLVITSDVNNVNNWSVTINSTIGSYSCVVPGLVFPAGKLECTFIFEPYIGQNVSNYNTYVKANNTVLQLSLNGGAAYDQPAISHGDYPFNLFKVDFVGSNVNLDYVKLEA